MPFAQYTDTSTVIFHVVPCRPIVQEHPLVPKIMSSFSILLSTWFIVRFYCDEFLSFIVSFVGNKHITRSNKTQSATTQQIVAPDALSPWKIGHVPKAAASTSITNYLQWERTALLPANHVFQLSCWSCLLTNRVTAEIWVSWKVDWGSEEAPTTQTTVQRNFSIIAVITTKSWSSFYAMHACRFAHI